MTFSGSYTIMGTMTTSGTATFNMASVNLQNVVVNSSGSLAGTANMTVPSSGAVTVNGGSLAGSGTFTIAAGGMLNLNTGTLNQNVTNQGSATWSGNGVGGSGSFTNQTGAVFTVTSGNNFTSTFTNQSGGNVTINGTPGFSALTNNGTVTINSGKSLSLGNGTDGGSYSIASAATLSFTGTRTLGAASSVSGAGNVTFGNGANITLQGSYNVSGTTTLTNSSSFAGTSASFNMASAAFGSLSMFRTGSINPSLSASANMTVNNTFTWSQGPVSGTGTLTIAAGGALNLQGNGGNMGLAFVNQGTTNWTGGVFPGAGAFTNQGVFNVQLSGSGSSSFSPAFTNQSGATLSNQTGNNTATFNGAFSNNGTVTVQSGALTINNASGGTGTFSVSSGTNLNFAGGTQTLGSGSAVTGAGAVAFSGGTTNVAGTYNVTGTTTISGATVNFTSPITNPGSAVTISSGTANFSTGAAVSMTALTLSGGTLSGSDTVTVTGSATWSGGTVTGSGTINFTNNVTLTASETLSGGRIIGGIGSITVSAGTLTVGAGGGTISSALTLSGATLVTTGPLALPATTSWTAGTIYGSGGVNITGTLTLSGSSAKLLGSTSAGTLNISGTLIHTGSGNLQFNGTSGGAVDIQAGGLYDLQSDAGILPLSGGAGTVTVSGGGTLRKSQGTGTSSIIVGVNNTGTVAAMSGGILAITGSITQFSSGPLSAGTWQASGNSTLRGFASAITTDKANILVDGSGSNFYTGASGTTNALGGLTSVTSAGSLTIQNGYSLTLSGNLSNAGNVTVGSGSTLAGPAGNFAYTQTGGTTELFFGTLDPNTVSLQGGALWGPGTIVANVTNSGGTIYPSGPFGNGNGLGGILNITGNYTQTAGGTLNIDVDGASPGNPPATGYDQLNVSGTATLGGTLSVNLITGFTPSAPNDQILTFSTRNGTDFGSKTGLLPYFTAVYNDSASPANLSLVGATPTVTSISPTTAVVGSGQFTVTVNGTNFVSGSTVQWNGSSLSTTYVSGTQVTATVPASDLTSAGNDSVTVANPSSGTSTPVSFTVTPANTTTTVASSGTADAGQTVTFSASVAVLAPGSGTPTGTVQFQVDGSNDGSPVALSAQDTASITDATLAVGSHTIDAIYSGDSNFNGSTSNNLGQTINADPTMGPFPQWG